MPVNVFEPYSIPASGETFRCLSHDDHSYKMEWIVAPKGYVALEHIHFNQDEVFYVKEGSLKVVMDGKEYFATTGETLTVPKGVAHIAYNNAESKLECMVEYIPGLDQLKFAQCFAGMVHDGHYDKNGKINIPMMGFFLKHMNCRAMTRPTEIPAAFFGLALNMFYLVGLLKGWTKDFVRYTGQGGK